MTKSYQWYYDGVLIGGATGKTHTLTSGQTDSNLIECRVQVNFGTDSVASLAEYSSGATFTPTDLGAKLVAWWDFSDSSTLWADAGRTTAITNGTAIAYVDDKSSYGNDGIANTGSSAYTGTPDWNSAGYATYAATDRLATSDVAGVGEVTTTMEVFCAFSTTDTAFMLLGSDTNGTAYLGIAEDASSSTTLSGLAGTPSYETGGVAFAGTTRDNLHTDWATGSKVVASAHSVDLATATQWSTAQLAPMTYHTSGFSFVGDLYHFILTTALSAQERDDLQAWLAAN